VHVIGSVNADIVLRVESLPGPGATVRAGPPVRSGGGKGANAAVAAARDAAEVLLVAAVGRDADGLSSLDELRRDGVDTSAVAVLDGQPTGGAVICVDAAGENFVIVSAGANAALTSRHVESGLAGLRATDVCTVNFEIPEAAVIACLHAARAYGVRVLLNPSPVRPLPAEAFSDDVILVLNAGELEALTEAEDLERRVAQLRAQGCGAVVVTLGSEGVHISADGDRRVAAFPVRAVDTTGAGDTFLGVLAGATASGATLDAAVTRAAAAAALATTAVGARAAMPCREAIDALLTESV
jgi:ribokinase